MGALRKKGQQVQERLVIEQKCTSPAAVPPPFFNCEQLEHFSTHFSSLQAVHAVFFLLSINMRTGLIQIRQDEGADGGESIYGPNNTEVEKEQQLGRLVGMTPIFRKQSNTKPKHAGPWGLIT